jgi:hypothetical protein
LTRRFARLPWRADRTASESMRVAGSCDPRRRLPKAYRAGASLGAADGQALRRLNKPDESAFKLGHDPPSRKMGVGHAEDTAPRHGGSNMSTTVRATFKSHDQVKNVKDDLVSTGIPSEKIFVDEAANKIRVIMPKETQAAIVEIFERHGLTDVAR